MELRDRVIVVTGGAHGIGRALCERFAREGARAVVVADVDLDTAGEVAEAVDAAGATGEARACDVGRREEIEGLVEATETAYGRIDLFCANAGIACPGGVDLPGEEWRRVLDVNFMAHVHSSRAVLPGMLERGEGYLLHTASAAGLLTEVSSASYAVSKHAVVALAEWLAIAHGDDGIRVSCLCPLGVSTRMIEGDHPVQHALRQGAVSPEHVAETVVEAIAAERFLILPHPEVAEFERRRAGDRERWLAGMRRWRREVLGGE